MTEQLNDNNICVKLLTIKINKKSVCSTLAAHFFYLEIVYKTVK